MASPLPAAIVRQGTTQEVVNGLTDSPRSCQRRTAGNIRRLRIDPGDDFQRLAQYT